MITPQQISMISVQFATSFRPPGNASSFVVEVGTATSSAIQCLYSSSPVYHVILFSCPYWRLYDAYNITMRNNQSGNSRLGISEVNYAFRADRKGIFHHFNLIVRNLSSWLAFTAFPPPLTDCSEIYRTGFHAPGFYLIDLSKQRDKRRTIQVYCDGGWTHILRRIAVWTNWYFNWK